MILMIIMNNYELIIHGIHVNIVNISYNHGIEMYCAAHKETQMKLIFIFDSTKTTDVSDSLKIKVSLLKLQNH